MFHFHFDLEAFFAFLRIVGAIVSCLAVAWAFHRFAEPKPRHFR